MSPAEKLAREMREWPDQVESIWCVDGSTGNYISRAEWQAAVDALKAGAWNGEGLPPVGTVCAIKRAPHGDWGEGIVRFSSSNVIVWDWSDEPAINGKCTAYAHEVECRPIRTPEQIASEEREKFIDEMIKVTCIRRGEAGLIYDAGYRKQEQE